MLDFSKAKILVIGDVMLDEYWSGDTGRISPEAPVPVVKIKTKESRLGGAANVAFNLKALGVNVEIAAIVGKDAAAHEIQSILEQSEINQHFYQCEQPTIRKLRIMSRHQQLIRMDFEETFNHESAKSFADSLNHIIPNFDLVIFSDYAKGTLGNIQQMISLTNQNNIPSFVDPKGDSFKQYSGATLIKPNQSEFSHVTSNFETSQEFEQLAQKLIDTLKIENLLVTRSENGMALFHREETPVYVATQAQDVYDVTGAGDTVIATLAAAFANGYKLEKAMNLSNLAASIVVAKVGTATVSLAELNETLNKQQRHEGYVAPSSSELKHLVMQAQKNNERVVFTNGCFDILHSGHVRYLEEAAKEGDKLIIAVNTDESVQALKGPTRPIIPLESRMELLASLNCVDWVIPFSEETPRELICFLKPDILVKGGDYKPEEIAGSECVWDNGGEVKTLSLWQGFSTTNIVDRIQQDSGVD